MRPPVLPFPVKGSVVMATLRGCVSINRVSKGSRSMLSAQEGQLAPTPSWSGVFKPLRCRLQEGEEVSGAPGCVGLSVDQLVEQGLGG